MSEALTDVEVKVLRSILSAFSPDEWRAIKRLAMAANGGGGGAAPAGGHAVADDADLDSQYGDPEVRRDPKRWAGASYVGAHYSQCPSDYLVMLAESLEYFAGKDKEKPNPKKHRNGTPFWQYDLRDAGRARGWAARNKGKQFTPPERPIVADSEFEEVPAAGGDASDPGEEWVP